MSSTTKIFNNYLKKRELRNTPERFTILAEIDRIQGHFEADTLLLRLKTRHKKISRATIYRSLALLLDCGLVRRIDFNAPAPHTLYESVTSAGLAGHDHFICQQCGKIIEFYDQRLKKIQLDLQAAYHLEVLHYSYHLYGRCGACKKRESNVI